MCHIKSVLRVFCVYSVNTVYDMMTINGIYSVNAVCIRIPSSVCNVNTVFI